MLMSRGAAPSDFEPNLCLQSGLEQICWKDRLKDRRLTLCSFYVAFKFSVFVLSLGSFREDVD